jgi:hypothetical protein
MEENKSGKDPWEILEDLTNGRIRRDSGTRSSAKRSTDPGSLRLPCPRCLVEVLTPVSTGSDPYAVCHRCGSIFAVPLQRNRIPVLPPGVRVDATRERTRITVRWFRPIFLIIVAGTLIVYFLYLRGASGFARTLSNVLLAFLSYVFLAGTVNRSVITLDAELLRARHGPFPLFAGAEVRTDRVESFFVESRLKYTSYGRRTYYYVVARLAGSARAEVLKTVRPLERAVAVQQALAVTLEQVRKKRELRVSEGPVTADPSGL